MQPNKILREHSLVDGVGLWHHDGGMCSEKRTLLESGYIWLPYPSIMVEPQEFKPRRSIVSRYATKIMDNRFYGHVSVSDLPIYGTQD